MSEADTVLRARSRSAGGIALVLALVVLLSGCAAGANPSAGGTGADGFWQGLWHGLISPLTFVLSLFRDDVGIYEIRNNGGWYDFGFMFGMSIVFGGAAGTGSAPARRKRVKG